MWRIRRNTDQVKMLMSLENSQEIELGPLDLIALPPGIMRGFRNISPEQAILIAILGGDNVGNVTWSQSLLDAAEGKGITCDS